MSTSYALLELARRYGAAVVRSLWANLDRILKLLRDCVAPDRIIQMARAAVGA